jgi:hypothetical protein
MRYCQVCDKHSESNDRNFTKGGGTVCNSCIAKGLHPDLEYLDVVAICVNLGIKNDTILSGVKGEYDVLRRARQMLIEWHRDEVTDWDAADKQAVRFLTKCLPDHKLAFVDASKASSDPELLKRTKEMLVDWHEDDEIVKETTPTIYAERMLERMKAEQLGFAQI